MRFIRYVVIGLVALALVVTSVGWSPTCALRTVKGAALEPDPLPGASNE